jgi:hypothetical protein
VKPEGLRKSQEHERRLAKKYDGQRSAGSGSFWSRKGDVRSDKLALEHKYTGNKKSLTVKKEWLDTVEKDAIKDSRMPVLAFHLGGRDYFILTEDDFTELAELAGFLNVARPGEMRDRRG